MSVKAESKKDGRTRRVEKTSLKLDEDKNINKQTTSYFNLLLSNLFCLLEFEMNHKIIFTDFRNTAHNSNEWNI